VGGGGYDDGASAGGYEDEAGYSGAARGVGMAAPGDAHAPFDPRRQGGELVMALAGSADEDGMFDYFDKGFGKNWAGAEHWKLRKVSRKGTLYKPTESFVAYQQTQLLPPLPKRRRWQKRPSLSTSPPHRHLRHHRRSSLPRLRERQYRCRPLPSLNDQVRSGQAARRRSGRRNGCYRTTCTSVVGNCYDCSSSRSLL